MQGPIPSGQPVARQATLWPARPYRKPIADAAWIVAMKRTLPGLERQDTKRVGKDLQKVAHGGFSFEGD